MTTLGTQIRISKYYDDKESKMTDTTDKKKGRLPKKVVYPIFERLAQSCDADYWKQVLDLCSKSKFPKGCSFKEGKLIYRKGKNISLIDIDEEIPDDQNLEMIIKFFRHTGVCDYNQIQSVEETPTPIKEEVYNSWKEVKKKQVKENLLNLYVQKLTKELNLKPREVSLLESKISLANLFKYITYSTVIMENGRIKDIIGFRPVTDERGFRDFVFPETAAPKTRNSSTKSATPSTPFTPSLNKRLDPIKSIEGVWNACVAELHKRQLYYDSIS